MEPIYFSYDAEAWRFKTISEFKDSVGRGAEVNFEWNGREYHICPVWPDGGVKYYIAPLDTLEETIYDSPEAMLNYMVGGDRLRDIITRVQVTDRTL